ncbi:FAD-dependent oxidoreductase [Paenibacillus psychroresistens]|uniref:FAD-dependent oxidoreductase n=1 Tax=Paenibacillus psychroresistens TaxID=1778678 RepID=A0A6B8RG48_9BACL|nr:FAD-dependent oxidoreductase [Paenibacillus psychroresistens]QGQ95431.1 FAD-dependent oxidoreductase [Paenibacillus psychroresistens]
MLRNWLIVFITVVVLISSGGGWLIYSANHEKHVDQTLQALLTVKSVAKVQNKYDVIVVGTDPEGITAAVSAARNGLKTLLVDGRDRKILGGLMTLGWLNSIDLNYDYAKESVLAGKHAYLNEGIFSEWYSRIEGKSFDVRTAANAFYELVKKEKNIDVLLETKTIVPEMKNSTVTGLTITLKNGTKQSIRADAIIDATQDADIAYAAGVPFTIGREDLGDSKAQMAVTAVFRLKNVTKEVWEQIKKRLNDGTGGPGADETSAWGYKGMYDYKAVDPKLASMRGLNIGRQNDNTILLNSLLLYQIDPLDPASRNKAVEQAKKELPHVLDFMKKMYPEFASVELDGIAPELYVRETRHMQGEYRLTIVDLLENKDHWDRIGFGSYEGDIQPSSPGSGGGAAVVLDPYKYAIPFRSIVPLKVDGILVVGRSASYDTLAHGSARVIPNGMAEGQAAGAAAKVAKDRKLTFRQMSASKDSIVLMQSLLNKQGMDLQPYKAPKEDYMSHKDYEGLKVAVYIGSAYGSYGNDFGLDKPANAQTVINEYLAAKRKYPQVFTGDPSAAKLNMVLPDKVPASLNQVSYTISSALNISASLDQALGKLQEMKLVSKATLNSIKNKESLTNGNLYMILKDVLAAKVDLHFE